MCHLEEQYLFSHVGISKTFCRNNDIDVSNIEDDVIFTDNLKEYLVIDDGIIKINKIIK